MEKDVEVSRDEHQSKLERYLAVLKAVNCGEHKPSRIMHAVNLPMKSLKEAIKGLEVRGLIEYRYINNQSYLCITEKGRRILKTLESLSFEFNLFVESPDQQICSDHAGA